MLCFISTSRCRERSLVPDHLSVFMSYQAERETLKTHYRALPLCHSCTQITDVRRLPSQQRLFRTHLHLSVISVRFSMRNFAADVVRVMSVSVHIETQLFIGDFGILAKKKKS